MILCLLNLQIHCGIEAGSINTIFWWSVCTKIEQTFQVFMERQYRFEEYFEKAIKTIVIGLQQIHRERGQCSPPHKSGSAELLKYPCGFF